MAREIVIWCDVCLSEDVRTPAADHSVGLALGVSQVVATKTLALCSNHTDEHLKPLAALLEEFGEPIELDTPNKQAVKPRVHASTAGNQAERLALTFEQSGTRKGQKPRGGRYIECFWCPLTYGATAGFVRHLRTAHGFDGYLEALGDTCPICGGGPYVQMTSHVLKTHHDLGLVGLTQPYTWARDHGDPHGVWADVANRKGSLDPEQEWEAQREHERGATRGRSGPGGKRGD